jgi:hypothetical protein
MTASRNTTAEINMPQKYDDDDEKIRTLYYSFEFRIRGEPHRIWYDPEQHKEVSTCGSDTTECLDDLVQEIRKLIFRHAVECAFDVDDLYKFLYKHLKASNKVDMKLAKSERKYQSLLSRYT